MDPTAQPPTSAIVEASVVLRIDQPERSLLDTRSTFPVPEFRPACVCCSTATPRTVDYDPGASDQLTGTIPVPLCQDCTGHIAFGRFKQTLIALAGGIGGVLLAVGILTALFADSGPGPFLIGLAGVAVAIGWYHLDTWLHIRSAKTGHHSMFEVWVGPGFATVRTTNPDVIAHLCRRYPGHELTQTPR